MKADFKNTIITSKNTGVKRLFVKFDKWSDDLNKHLLEILKPYNLSFVHNMFDNDEIIIEFN